RAQQLFGTFFAPTAIATWAYLRELPVDRARHSDTLCRAPIYALALVRAPGVSVAKASDSLAVMFSRDWPDDEWLSLGGGVSVPLFSPLRRIRPPRGALPPIIRRRRGRRPTGGTALA